MRRTIFYILITLLAFGGGIVAYKYHLQEVKEQQKLNYVTSLNENIRKIESENAGFEELEKANDGDLITVQEGIDEKFLCHDVTEEQPNICTTILIGNSEEKKSLIIRLKVCSEADNSNCIVWKPDNLCGADKFCSNRIRIYDKDSKPIDLRREVTFNDGAKGYTGESVQLKVTGIVSIEENKPKLLTPVEKIEIIGSNENIVRTEEDELINDRINAFFPIITAWMKNKKIAEYVKLEDIDLIAAHTKLLDVDGDNEKELAIKTACAPVGNCELWIYQKHLDGFNVIMKPGKDEGVQTFEPKKTKTNGYFDLETKSHGDAFSGGITVYKFDGKEYKASECSDYNHSELKDDKFYTFKKPKITPRECRE